jgi:hypothetical protein
MMQSPQGLREKENALLPGAQTERRGGKDLVESVG